METNGLFEAYAREMRQDYLRIVLAGFIAGIVGVLAQLRFNIGPVPFTMQNMGVVLAGILLPPLYSFLSITLYLFLIFIGLPFASGFSGGPMVLLGFTSGYLWGFLVSAPLFSLFMRKSGLLTRMLNKGVDKMGLSSSLLLSLVCFLPVYILGFLVFYHYAVPGSPLFDWMGRTAGFFGLALDSRVLLVFFVSVIIFLPQDLFMDHLLGILVGVKILRFLEERGIEIA